MLGVFAAIESGGKPTAQDPGSSYRGLLQLSDAEFRKYGGGNIYNAYDNARAAALKLRAESDEFTQKYGREPTVVDMYMQHQQGVGGYANHMANPDQPAWVNMAQTAEGRAKGDKWAKLAIWGNVPTRFKKLFGDVENLTSREFVDMWSQVIASKGKVGEFRDETISEVTPDALEAKPLSGVSKFIDAEKIPGPLPEESIELGSMAKKWIASGKESKNVIDLVKNPPDPLDDLDRMYLTPDALTPEQEQRMKGLEETWGKVWDNFPQAQKDYISRNKWIQDNRDDYLGNYNKNNKEIAKKYIDERNAERIRQNQEADNKIIREQESFKRIDEIRKRTDDVLKDLPPDLKAKMDQWRLDDLAKAERDNAEIDKRVGPLLSDLINGKITEYPDELADLIKEAEAEAAKEREKARAERQKSKPKKK